MQYRLFAIIAFAATAVAYPQSDIPVRDVAASGNDVKTAVMPSVGTPTTMDSNGPQIVPIDTKEPTKTGPNDGKMSALPFTPGNKNNSTRPFRPPGRPMFPGIKNNGTDAGFCIELSGMPMMGKMGGMKPKNHGGPKMSDVKSIETRDNHKGDDSDDDDDDKKMPNVKTAGKHFQPKGQNGKWGGMDKGDKGGRGRGGFGRKMRSVRCVRYAEAKCAGSEVKKGTKDVKAKSIKCTRKKMAGGMRGGMKKGGMKWGKPKNGTSDVKIQAREFEDDEATFDIEDDLEDEEIEELEGRSIPLF